MKNSIIINILLFSFPIFSKQPLPGWPYTLVEQFRVASDKKDIKAIDEILSRMGVSSIIEYDYQDCLRECSDLEIEAKLKAKFAGTWYCKNTFRFESLLRDYSEDPKFEKAVRIYVANGKLSYYLQLKGAKAIGDRNLLYKISKNIALRRVLPLGALVAFGSYVASTQVQ
jgi:hypothetical protein